MKKIALFLLLLPVLFLISNKYIGQGKTGYISLNELLNVMPEFKKADSSLSQYHDLLVQQFDAYQKEYSEQVNFLSSKDTVKYSKIQMDVKRQNLSEMYSKIQGYNQQASQLLDQKKQDLILPLQTKANDAIKAVAKENDYSYVLEKDVLHVYPLADDLLPLVKRKLGIK